jgi:hypothetical protein
LADTSQEQQVVRRASQLRNRSLKQTVSESSGGVLKIKFAEKPTIPETFQSLYYLKKKS